MKRNAFIVHGARSASRWMLLFGAIVQVATIGVFLNAGVPLWRLAALLALFAAFSGMQRLTARKVAASSCFDRWFMVTNLSSQIYVVSSAALTGGINSPFVGGLVLPAIISLLFFGPQPVSRWTALANGLLIVAMACLPTSVVGPHLPAGAYTAALLINLGWSLIVLHNVVGKIAFAALRAGDSMACLREERVTEAEAQLRRLQSVGAKVAHELKNPLTSIKGLCQLVARAPEGPRTQERLTVVASEISRMETILSEYLSFSRPLEDLKPESLDLSAVSRDVLDVLGGRAEQAGVALELDGHATRAAGDPRRLKEALINLVANAIEATPNGGSVTLRLRSSPSEVTLEVRDTGRGIAPDDLERLGTSFFTTRPGGTGLGVVLAQGVIAQHGGQLRYNSSVGNGTTATITLPIQPVVACETAARAALVEARA
jgi:signal transduction histidine kinase